VAPRVSPGAAGALAAACLLAASLLGAAPAGGAASGPVAQAPPTVIGTAAAGKLLTGLSGTWAGFGSISYRFQWYRCNAAGAACQTIHGATSPTFALRDRDVGKTVGLGVRANDSTGTTIAYAGLVGPIAPHRPLLESTAQPVVTGPPVVGKTVIVTTGTWSPVPSALAYRWERCNPNGRACAAIAGATESSYTVTGADLGHALLAIVQASNSGTIQNAFSTATPAVVDASVNGPAPAVGPAVSGVPVVGQQLSATAGIWRGVGPIVFDYRWYRCDPTGAHCQPIPTRGTVYTAAPRDAGQTIGLALRATDSTGAVSAYASLVGPVAVADSALTPTTAPTITGTARVGGTLRADDGIWTGRPRSFGYAWLRCNRNGRLCTPIAGATRASYRPTLADKSHTLVVSVVATAGGASQSALTAATAPIS
jgi:hypothetical protein